jgi:hypothetical protein
VKREVVVALVLAGAGAFLCVRELQPTRAEVARLQADLERSREEQHAARAERARLNLARRAPAADAVGVRARVLDVLRPLPVRDARLSVAAGSARVSVSGRSDHDTAVLLAERLARNAGLALDDVRFDVAGDGDLRFTIGASVPGVRKP